MKISKKVFISENATKEFNVEYYYITYFNTIDINKGIDILDIPNTKDHIVFGIATSKEEAFLLFKKMVEEIILDYGEVTRTNIIEFFLGEDLDVFN